MPPTDTASNRAEDSVEELEGSTAEVLAGSAEEADVVKKAPSAPGRQHMLERLSHETAIRTATFRG